LLESLHVKKKKPNKQSRKQIDLRAGMVLKNILRVKVLRRHG
jgi:hypothetical protein